ncbi:hypothetical protein FHS27_004779 [Rhodopirellula rubra]|uniref:Uncharacterized protein n=1 Tax=Aporhodopirellula rubra TaxID=980271 RepID=A0A7W5H8D2_9BACT|nr:hypothetical protein [Aporhodopirellula rubra]MBB3208945.1 hypothetical protein [Aporhodopirellula rubra]
MSEFISAVEAGKLTPVSASTIKRFIRDVVDDHNHESRDKIQPSPEELKRAQEAGEPYRWKIEREFVIEQFGTAEESKKGDDGETSSEVLNILRQQLEAKDQQIRTLETQLDRKDDQIKRQDDRMQETHVLMQDLQKRLALTAPAPETITVEESKIKKDEVPKTKRPLFGGLFQRKKEGSRS